jgi:hypothetical protein
MKFFENKTNSRSKSFVIMKNMNKTLQLISLCAFIVALSVYYIHRPIAKDCNKEQKMSILYDSTKAGGLSHGYNKSFKHILWFSENILDDFSYFNATASAGRWLTTDLVYNFKIPTDHFPLRNCPIFYPFRK